MIVHKILPIVALGLNLLLLGSALAQDRRSPRNVLFAFLVTALAVQPQQWPGYARRRAGVGAAPSRRRDPDPRALLPLRHRAPRPAPPAPGAHRRLRALRRVPPRRADPALRQRRDGLPVGVHARRGPALRPVLPLLRELPGARARPAAPGLPQAVLELQAQPHAPGDPRRYGEPARRRRRHRPLHAELGLALPDRHPEQRGLRAGAGRRHRPLPAHQHRCPRQAPHPLPLHLRRARADPLPRPLGVRPGGARPPGRVDTRERGQHADAGRRHPPARVHGRPAPAPETRGRPAAADVPASPRRSRRAGQAHQGARFAARGHRARADADGGAGHPGPGPLRGAVPVRAGGGPLHAARPRRVRRGRRAVDERGPRHGARALAPDDRPDPDRRGDAVRGRRLCADAPGGAAARARARGARPAALHGGRGRRGAPRRREAVGRDLRRRRDRAPGDAGGRDGHRLEERRPLRGSPVEDGRAPARPGDPRAFGEARSHRRARGERRPRDQQSPHGDPGQQRPLAPAAAVRLARAPEGRGDRGGGDAGGQDRARPPELRPAAGAQAGVGRPPRAARTCGRATRAQAQRRAGGGRAGVRSLAAHARRRP